MSDGVSFADGAFAVHLRGFPRWLLTALAGEWYVSWAEGGPPASSNGVPLLVLRSAAADRPSAAAARRRFSLHFGDGHLVARRRAVRVDLSAEEVVVELPHAAKARDAGPALLAQTKVALLRCLASAGALALHAAAFEVGDDRWLCAGASNSGKSTLATLALRQGGRIVSDDSLLVWRQAETVQVAPLRRDVHLRSATALILPPEHRRYSVSSSPGARVTLNRADMPAAFTPRLLPRKLLLCRIDRRRARTRVRRISQGDALSGLILATSAAYLAREFPALHRATWAVVEQLVGTVESYHVELGREVLEDPDGAWVNLRRSIGS